MHYRNPEREARLGLFFTTETHATNQGQPVNAEPHKCAKVDWFPLDTLPTNTVPYTAAGIDLYRRGANLAVVGWTYQGCSCPP